MDAPACLGDLREGLGRSGTGVWNMDMRTIRVVKGVPKMKMKKAAALFFSLSVLTAALVFPSATASASDGTYGGQVLSHTGNGDPVYTTQSYSGNLQMSMFLRFDGTADLPAELLLHQDGQDGYSVALSASGISTGRMSKEDAVQTDYAFQPDVWYELEVCVVDGTVTTAVNGQIEAIYQDLGTPLTGGTVGFGGTGAYSLDSIGIQELLGPQIVFSDSFGDGTQDGSDYTVPMDPIRDYTLEFTMNTEAYSTGNWGRGAEITLRDGITLRFMNDALALTGVGTEWEYSYAALLKTENYLQTDRRIQIRLFGNFLEVSVDGVLVYTYSGEGLDKAAAPIRFKAQEAEWTLDDLSIAVGTEKRSAIYQDAQVHAAPFTVPNMARNYRLTFDMKIDSYDSSDWGRAARVTLRNGIILHFMKDALAVEGIQSNYEYSYVEEAKLGNYLGQTVPVSIDMFGNAFSVWVSDTLVYSYSGEALADKATCDIAFGSWDVTWSASNICISSAPVTDSANASFDPPINAKGYYIPDFIWSDYTLDFNMNVASFDQPDWGRAARVKLKDGTIVHFMRDALALEGEDGGYVYGYDDLVKIENHLQTDIAVKMVVQGNSLTVYMDGVKAYEYTGSALEKPASLISFDSWDVTWSLSSVSAQAAVKQYAFFDFEGETPTQGLTESPAFQVKPMGQPGQSTGSSSSGTTQPSSVLPEGVLYYTDFGGTPYEGMNPAEGAEAVAFSTDKDYGTEFILETVIHVNSIGDGDGRGVKFILGAGQNNSSGDTELWIGKNAIWACTDGWKGHTAFDFSPYMDKDTAVKITAEGNQLTLSLDGKEVWSAEDPTFASPVASKIQLGGWDAKYLIKEVKISRVDADNPMTGVPVSTFGITLILGASSAVLLFAGGWKLRKKRVGNFS